MIKRYDFEINGINSAPDGDWVKYDDLKKLLGELYKDKERLDWLNENDVHERAEGVDQYWVKSTWAISTENEGLDLRGAIDEEIKNNLS